MKLKITEDILRVRAGMERQEALMRAGVQTDEGTGLAYFTGYSYRTLYDWDQYFEAVVQYYMGWDSQYIKNGVLIFLHNQEESGFIPRHIPRGSDYFPEEHVKPFLSQIALLVADNYGETDWILQQETLEKLKKYLNYWLFDLDQDGNGLSEWMSSPHTGMDNQHERAGYWGDGFSEGVDLNCYLVAECAALARLLELGGDSAGAEIYRGYAASRKVSVNALLWCEEEGFYYDRNLYPDREKSPRLPWPAAMNRARGSRIAVKSVSGFSPLYFGVADGQRADRMIGEHLINPDEFWTPFPVSALAKSEPWFSSVPLPADCGCNWRAATWIPTNYMLVHGLKKCGWEKLADALAQKTRLLVERGRDREWYDTLTGEGRGLDPFWGWSLLGRFLGYEEVLQYDV